MFLLYSRVKVKVRISVRFTVSVVSGYAHLSGLLSVVVVPYPLVSVYGPAAATWYSSAGGRPAPHSVTSHD